MKRKKQSNEQAPEDVAIDESPDDDEAAGRPADTESELEQVIREREEFRAHWQRAQADYQNLKRRHLTEVEQSRKRTMQPLLESLLVVLDHIDMALASETTSPDAKNLALGVRLTRDQFVHALQQEGVTPIATDGPFDPRQHEAVATVEDPDREPGSIVAVVRAGWRWGETVLRPAHVSVVAAPELPAAEEESDETEEPEEGSAHDAE